MKPRRPLPKRWELSPRPVFSHYERRLYKHLQQALPHHVILAKLPLVRICQPSRPGRVRYWFDLLGSVHVGFVVCSPAGRAMAALDLDDGRPTAARTQRIKEQVLRACHLPYLRCIPGHWPNYTELQQLVPEVVAPAAPARPTLSRAHTATPQVPDNAPNSLPAPHSRSWAPTLAEANRPAKGGRWKHSGFGQDALFNTENLPIVNELASGYGLPKAPLAAAATLGPKLADSATPLPSRQSPLRR